MKLVYSEVSKLKTFNDLIINSGLVVSPPLLRVIQVVRFNDLTGRKFKLTSDENIVIDSETGKEYFNPESKGVAIFNLHGRVHSNHKVQKIHYQSIDGSKDSFIIDPVETIVYNSKSTTRSVVLTPFDLNRVITMIMEIPANMNKLKNEGVDLNEFKDQFFKDVLKQLIYHKLELFTGNSHYSSTMVAIPDDMDINMVVASSSSRAFHRDVLKNILKLDNMLVFDLDKTNNEDVKGESALKEVETEDSSMDDNRVTSLSDIDIEDNEIHSDIKKLDEMISSLSNIKLSAHNNLVTLKIKELKDLRSELESKLEEFKVKKIIEDTDNLMHSISSKYKLEEQKVEIEIVKNEEDQLEELRKLVEERNESNSNKNIRSKYLNEIQYGNQYELDKFFARVFNNFIIETGRPVSIQEFSMYLVSEGIKPGGISGPGGLAQAIFRWKKIVPQIKGAGFGRYTSTNLMYD